MKTVINNEETPRLELFKRILYSFQVLIIGVAIPVLFFLGISTREDQKKAKENEMSISANSSKLTASSAIDLSIKGI